MSLHHEIKGYVEKYYNDRLDRPAQLLQDCLQIYFDSGLSMEIRYLNSSEYSLKWTWGDAELQIDTAPLHKELSTYPNHFHDADAKLCPDPVTKPGSEPWGNIQRLIEKLLQDPLIESV